MWTCHHEPRVEVHHPRHHSNTEELPQQSMTRLDLLVTIGTCRTTALEELDGTDHTTPLEF